MYFILEQSVEDSVLGHVLDGDLIDQETMLRFCGEHGNIKAQCFASMDAALEWNRNQ